MVKPKRKQKIVEKPWSEMTREELFLSLQTSKDGLVTRVAVKRREEFGLNTIPEERPRGVLSVFFRQVSNPLVLVLIAAALITMFLRDVTDTLVIGLAVLINVSVGFFQEFKAERALLALKAYLEPMAIVLRDGKEHTIPSSHLVPGDIIILRSGSRVPADARLLEAIELGTNESALTGESYPVEKVSDALRPLASGKRAAADLKNMVFAGTVVTEGIGRAAVIATGSTTEIGRIAALLHVLPEGSTPLQDKLSRLSRGLAGGILGIAALVFAVGVILGRSLLEMFTVAVALAVSAIPEGLVIAVTAILAIGMQRILKQGALVRRLVAAETLGSTTVICTDKTGTLTEARMRLARMMTADGETVMDHLASLNPVVRRSLEVAALGNTTVVESTSDDPETWQLVGSPTEAALVRGAGHAGVFRETLIKEQPLIDMIPFTATRKYVMTLHKRGDATMLYAVGAAERVLTLSSFMLGKKGEISMQEKMRQAWEEHIEQYARDGFRVLGLAYREGKGALSCAKVPDCEGQLTFVGLAIIEDPLREDVPEMLRESQRAGIRTVMITGDHAATATHIARTLGIYGAEATRSIDGAALDRLGDEALRDRVEEFSVYSRVTPEQKFRIVQAWQARGAVVAVTGDGVNDGPALKRADIGVAVGAGTDVAKEASDLVLLNNSFTTLVHAIREGRIIYDTIRKVALYLLSDSFSEIILVVGALIVGAPLPLLAAQILWINLVTDGFPSVALTVDPATRDVMAARPVSREQPIIDRKRIVLILVVSLVTGLGNLFLFQWWHAVTGDLIRARTLVFASLGIDSLLYVFSIRSLQKPLWRVAPWSNPWLLIAVAAGFALTVAGVMVPQLQRVLETTALNGQEWGIVIGASVAILVLIEVSKIMHNFFHKSTEAQKH